jgi:uncharacterized protein (DUF1810 family)
VDAIKLRSCVTLVRAAEDDPLAQAILDRWWDGVTDTATLALLAGQAPGEPERR